MELAINSKREEKLTLSQVEACSKKGCFLVVGRLKLPVKVLGYKWEMGHHRFLVSPVNGSGEVWKNQEALEFV